MQAIIALCEKFGFNEKQQGFDIKIPSTGDFDEFADYINKLKNVLKSCPYLTVDGESIEISSVDIGSIWLKFKVLCKNHPVVSAVTATALTLNNLAVLVDKCVKIKSHIITCQQQEEQYRAMSLKNDILESVINANEVATETIINKMATEMQDELKEQTLNAEQVNSLKMSMRQLSDLMLDGLEIYASIDTPDEVKDLFPTSDEIKGLTEPIKSIPEKTETE